MTRKVIVLSARGLDSNLLSGTLPSQLGSLNLMQQLFAGNNLLSGTLSSSLAGWTGLQMLHISRNLISGSSAPEFAHTWASLELFSVYGNKRLDWDLSLLNHWGSTATFLVQASRQITNSTLHSPVCCRGVL